MKKKYVFNILGIALVILIIILVNYITIYLLDNLEIERIKKINKISVQDNLDENSFYPHNIEETDVGKILNRENSLLSVSDSNKNLLNMSDAINIALRDLELFKESEIIPQEIDIGKINQTYAALKISAPYSILEEEEKLEKEFSIFNDSTKDAIFEEFNEEYYFWDVKFVGEDMDISIYINNYTGNVWGLTIVSSFDKISSIKSNEEILKSYSQYLGISYDDNSISTDKTLGTITVNCNDFRLGAYTAVEQYYQYISFSVL